MPNVETALIIFLLSQQNLYLFHLATLVFNVLQVRKVKETNFTTKVQTDSLQHLLQNNLYYL